LPRGASNITESKSGPLPGLLSDILPSIVALATPQKAAEIRQLIQSQLPNPPSPPIISPRPADINAPACRCPLARFFSIWPAIFYLFRHGSLVVAFFPSWIYTSTAEGSLAFPCPSGTMEVGRWYPC